AVPAAGTSLTRPSETADRRPDERLVAEACPLRPDPGPPAQADPSARGPYPGGMTTSPQATDETTGDADQHRSGKRVLLAKPRGYCAGVDRAVVTVEKALETYGPPVYVRKEIVHNKHVVETLRERGVV